MSVYIYLLPLLVCLLAGTIDVRAQGFNLFNGRNHPELDWQVAETEHFQIMYPAHLAGIEVEAAGIAEATYAALSENLDVHFKKRLKIFLSDEDEILNGFAVRFGHTNIWVHVNDVSRVWTGDSKWLRTVLSHELAHLFHYEAIKGSLGFLDYFLGDPLPSFWAEGFAQYKTERWDAYRGDRWLRTAVLDDRLSYRDGLSNWNGRLMYAVGNSQLRYFAEQYGDTTLTKLLKHRKKSFFGLVKSHDFYTAFEEATDKSYRSFYDDWRRHVNVYYNTLAGQMENTDSLHVDPLRVPGQYVYDVQYAPDTSTIAVLSLESIQRPVVRLQLQKTKGKQKLTTLAEGAIQAPIAWSPDGTQLAFARRTRAKNGSLLNDLFLVSNSGKKTKRLTRGRRAISPSFSPDGQHIAFIGSEAGTANVFLLDLATQKETQLTFFTGDVQLSALDWNIAINRIAVSRFDANGRRNIFILNPNSQKIRPLPDLGRDARWPVWSPDGRRIAFTSLQDHVPNVFVYNLATDSTHRATYLVTGVTVHDWLPPDSTFVEGSLVVTSSGSKRRDRVFRIDASRRAEAPPPQLPPEYASWTTYAPPNSIALAVPGSAGLIEKRFRYRSGKNLIHMLTFGLPYYNASDDWGVAGVTAWTEPLGKHTLGLTGSVSFPTFRENSFVLASYVNNQLRPSLGLNLYSLIPTATAYGNTYALDGLTGGDLTMDLPLDVAPQPYTSTRFNARLLYASVDLLNDEDYASPPVGLPPPNSGERAEIRIGISRKKQRPYRYNLIHPLDGVAARLQITAGTKALGGDARFLQTDLAAYAVLPAGFLDRLFVYGKVQLQSGNSFVQDRPGFARFDDIQFSAPQVGLIAFSEADRVRGFRRFAYGDRVVFGTVEYRTLLMPSLETKILGMIELGATAGAAFVDAGAVWEDGDALARRIGLGAEIKNQLVIGGVLEVMHAIGIAQPAPDFGSTEVYDLYYRIRAALPF